MYSLKITSFGAFPNVTLFVRIQIATAKLDKLVLFFQHRTVCYLFLLYNLLKQKYTKKQYFLKSNVRPPLWLADPGGWRVAVL